MPIGSQAHNVHFSYFVQNSQITTTSRCRRLCGTIRDRVTQQRRPFLRFFACQEELSHELLGAPLPGVVASRAEPSQSYGPLPAVKVMEQAMGIESVYPITKVLQGKGVAPSPSFNWSQMESGLRLVRSSTLQQVSEP